MMLKHLRKKSNAEEKLEYMKAFQKLTFLQFFVHFIYFVKVFLQQRIIFQALKTHR